jgi:hypothetical protein
MLVWTSHQNTLGAKVSLFYFSTSGSNIRKTIYMDNTIEKHAHVVESITQVRRVTGGDNSKEAGFILISRKQYLIQPKAHDDAVSYTQTTTTSVTAPNKI